MDPGAHSLSQYLFRYSVIQDNISKVKSQVYIELDNGVNIEFLIVQSDDISERDPALTLVTLHFHFRSLSTITIFLGIPDPLFNHQFKANKRRGWGHHHAK